MASEKGVIWRFADVEVNSLTRELRVGGALVDVEPKPFDLLLLLLERAGEVVTQEEIRNVVWPGRIVIDAVVPNTISKLRRALGGDNHHLIVTVSRFGYRLVADVERRLLHGPAPQTLATAPGDPIRGRKQWKLIERLGGGGFGDVWVGCHVKTNERRIFKFCANEDHLSSLKREVTLYRYLREALGGTARIARILDWQFEEAPYFVESEYSGDNLRAWCDRRGGLAAVGLRQRIELAAEIADIVGAAHSAGVLHKDLKPENILVSQVDGRLMVKLCDFGAGQLLDSARVVALGITMLGFTTPLARSTAAPGTLIYFAPELLSGGTASVQSDVYALGVLLFQLALGQWLPIAPGWEADVEDEVLREDIALATDGLPARRLQSAQLLAERLRTQDARRKRLTEEREQQVRLAQAMQALERSRARRPWAFAFVGALVLGLGLSTFLLLRERRIVELAEQQRISAEQLNALFSQDMLRAADPDFGGKVDISLKQAILKELPLIPMRLSHNPLVEGDVDQKLAATLDRLSDTADAISLAHRAAQLFSDQLGAGDVRSLSAQADEIGYRLQTDPPRKLAPLFKALYPRLKASSGPADPTMLKARLIEARIAQMDNRVDEASKLLEQLLLDYPANAPNANIRDLDRIRTTYLMSLFFVHDFKQAESKAVQWLPHFISSYGERGRPTLELREALGRALGGWHGLGGTDDNYNRAAYQFQLVLQGYKELYGSESHEALRAEQHLADLAQDYGRWSEAIDRYRHILAGFSRLYGPASPWTIRLQLQYLYCLIENGNTADAVALAHDLVVAGRTKLLPSDFLYPYLLLYSAKALLVGNRLDEASALIDECARVLAKSPSENEESDARAALLYLEGIRAQKTGDRASAEKYLSQAVVQLSKTTGPDDTYTRDARNRLAALKAGSAS